MTSSNGNIFRVTGPLCGECTTQRPVTRSFDVFFDLRLNKRLRKQPWGWWFEMLSWSLWRHCNDLIHHYYYNCIFHNWSERFLKSVMCEAFTQNSTLCAMACWTTLVSQISFTRRTKRNCTNVCLLCPNIFEFIDIIYPQKQHNLRSIVWFRMFHVSLICTNEFTHSGLVVPYGIIDLCHVWVENSLLHDDMKT